MSRFLLFLCLCLLVGLGGVPRSRAEGRPNVLFLMVDDLRPELGCYGNRQVKTPNVDALTGAGVRFERS